MCQPASFIITRGKAWWSKASDSHEDIIAEFCLGELDADMNNVGIVRVEIVPPDNDMTKPLAKWIFQTDQDLIPDWYDPKFAEQLAREALVEWAAAKLFVHGEHRIEAAQFYASGSATVRAYGSATVRASDSATVVKWNSAATVALKSLAVEIDRSIYEKVSLRRAAD